MEEKKDLNRKIRILIGKVGLDGHDRGAKVIAAAFRDAGIEVIYTGLRQTAETIVEAALQEDVDAIGISILSGAHMTVFPKIKKLMEEKGLNDVLLFGGGIIPEQDIEDLKKIGVGTLFTPGTPTFATIDYVKDWVSKNRNN
jgi:methylmalonyl-CoA mutase C-terminal domain/subunit